MAMREIKTGILYVGSNHWDRRLFDELIPLPDGTTYNSYLIFGSEKTALIDSVDPDKQHELIANLENQNLKKLDYVISNHAEQDHSGSIPKVLEAFPGAKVVTNEKCKTMLMELLLLPEEKFITISDKSTISIGDRTLEFIIAPWVHWPETMLTYLREDKMLFPCDLFGAHLATSDLYANDRARVYESAKRYYAEIMMPFRNVIQKHLTKLEDFPMEIIAPSHGPVHRDVNFIIDAYRDWTSDTVKNEVILPYVSMHGSTEKMVQYFIDALIKRDITVKPFNLTKTDIGELAIALVDAATIVIAAPTVLVGPHPAAVYATYLANALRPKARYASVIGSYGWGGKMLEHITSMLGNLKVELLQPVIAKGHPKESDFEAVEKLADAILERHRGIGIV
ncbi:MAG: FprA family A-type flavoprotein [candidate division WOR-3 bacterium]|nr:MAG: FprA family A-type flavoprotein [candidate division WOR-3 bacterium]